MLKHFTSPASIAVIGASGNPDKIGGRPIAFLKRAGYGGRIIPVNPKSAEIQGLAAVTSLREAEGSAELAIIALAARFVPDSIRDCIATGVKAAIVLSSGVEGEAAEAAFAEARAAGLRLVGPNSLGTFSTASGAFTTFATALDGAWPKPGRIAIVSQSGAFGSYLYALIDLAGGGVSHFLATGNEEDLSTTDLLGALAKDDATDVIVLANEGIKDGPGLLDAIRAARKAGKSVIALKTGRSDAGRQAAATHTGSLAGEDSVYDAAIRQAGAIRVHGLEEAADIAVGLTRRPRMAGDRLGVVTTSGGVGVLLSDIADEAGLAMPPLPDSAVAEIAEFLPFAEGVNPVDSSTQILADMSLFERLLSTTIRSGAFDGLVIFLAHIGRNDAHFATVSKGILAAARAFPDVPIAVSMVATEANRAVLEDAGIPVFEEPARAVRLLAGLRAQTVAATVEASGAGLPALPAAGTLNETDAARWLADLGLPMALQAHAADEDATVAAAEAMGYPVVLKVSSPDILHKSDVGGVLLNIPDAKRLREGYNRVMASVSAAMPEAAIDGVTVAKQVQDGPELILGTTTDPDFGPVVMVGIGGTTAELYKDVAFRVAPFDTAEAHKMLAELRGHALLTGFRQFEAADTGALAAILARISEVVFALREQNLGIEINPIRLSGADPIGLDAVVTTG